MSLLLIANSETPEILLAVFIDVPDLHQTLVLVLKYVSDVDLHVKCDLVSYFNIECRCYCTCRLLRIRRQLLHVHIGVVYSHLRHRRIPTRAYPPSTPFCHGIPLVRAYKNVQYIDQMSIVEICKTSLVLWCLDNRYSAIIIKIWKMKKGRVCEEDKGKILTNSPFSIPRSGKFM